MGRTEKHLKKIEAELTHGESVIASTNATATNPGESSGTISGALVITNARVLFSGNSIGTSSSKSTPIGQVTSVDLHKGLMLSHVEVSTATGIDRYLVKYKEAAPFIEAAHRALAMQDR